MTKQIYGKGQPLVMLHGGVYGYIDEFEYLIPRLAEHYMVICIATRGHGKSEIGTEPFSYRGRALDAYKVIRSITKDSVTVVGFSEGGFAGLELAALHPELVKRLVAMGVGDYGEDHPKDSHYTPENLMRSDSAFFARRLKLMPEPARWREFLDGVGGDEALHSSLMRSSGTNPDQRPATQQHLRMTGHQRIETVGRKADHQQA
ncbi:alpha/beta fold hydrolase [Puia dinghuensis]|uniref:alpha/beta fold hydrolase n=1 Tax=Puia dinghuensis TaxID=1792502 RepID=UPI001666D379|nr:alpha/beta fold hydrolase [Puia dinghuensis]